MLNIQKDIDSINSLIPTAINEVANHILAKIYNTIEKADYGLNLNQSLIFSTCRYTNKFKWRNKFSEVWVGVSLEKSSFSLILDKMGKAESTLAHRLLRKSDYQNTLKNLLLQGLNSFIEQHNIKSDNKISHVHVRLDTDSIFNDVYVTFKFADDIVYFKGFNC